MTGYTFKKAEWSWPSSVSNHLTWGLLLLAEYYHNK